MKKIINIFFVVLGVIFFIIILSGIYFYVTDPLNLKPLFLGSEKTESINNGASGTTTSTTDSHPFLSDSQQEALQKFGIDPDAIPSEFTAEQEACFETKLGEERVGEIKAGDSPTATEYFKARDCI